MALSRAVGLKRCLSLGISLVNLRPLNDPTPPTMTKSSIVVPSNYGIVIDAGSSGSRIHVYKWGDPELTQMTLLDSKVHGDFSEHTKTQLASLPDITHKKDWNKKISPGISSFGKKYHGKTSRKDQQRFANDLWENHLEDLVEFAEKIIPNKSDQENTPIFLLATAGMRLLPQEDQTKILSTSCELLKNKTHFKIPDCDSHVDVIDGQTEGLYGWLALNYLLDQFDDHAQSDNNNNKKLRNTFGFMDMGGASTQIAFLPNENESLKHFDDLYNVNLRTLDGRDFAWDVFVSSWLGFGANEARRRHLENLKIQKKPHLLNQADYDFDIIFPKSLKSSKQKTLMVRHDPCSPKGHLLEQKDKDESVFLGVGNFKQCFNGMYSLLQKELPCLDKPCLFGGIHVPEIDFSTNKFIGISEFWYTSQDLFQMQGDYDFQTFKTHVDSYCSKPWKDIMNDRDYHYSGLDDEKLQAACFKASWIINILHEGFGLPMTSNPMTNFGENNKLVHYLDSKESANIDFDSLDPFRSVESVNNKELSWTLGRILLYASSQVPTIDGVGSKVGFMPSISSPSAEFVYGGESVLKKTNNRPINSSRHSFFAFGTLSVFMLICAILILIGYILFPNTFNSKRRHVYHQLKFNKLKTKIADSPIFKHLNYHYGIIKASCMGRYNIWRYGYGILDTTYQRAMEEGGGGEREDDFSDNEARNEYYDYYNSSREGRVSSPPSFANIPLQSISRADTFTPSALEMSRRHGLVGQFSASTPNLSILMSDASEIHLGGDSSGNNNNNNKDYASSNPYLTRNNNGDSDSTDHLDNQHLIKSTSRLFSGNMSRGRQVLGNKSPQLN